jgi:hypothetical protein
MRAGVNGMLLKRPLEEATSQSSHGSILNFRMREEESPFGIVTVASPVFLRFL